MTRTQIPSTVLRLTQDTDLSQEIPLNPFWFALKILDLLEGTSTTYSA